MNLSSEIKDAIRWLGILHPYSWTVQPEDFTAFEQLADGSRISIMLYTKWNGLPIGNMCEAWAQASKQNSPLCTQ